MEFGQTSVGKSTTLLVGIIIVLSKSLEIQGLFWDSEMWPWNEEKCNDDWISTSFTGQLELKLSEQLFGQHLVHEPLLKYLKDFERGNPRTPLVLSLHGRSGTGKSMVAKLVVEHMFKKGIQSKFVHLLSSVGNFPHESKLSSYKDELRDIIESAVSACERSVFIIDEMHNMPTGLFDTLKPYLSDYQRMGSPDYRKSVFFFLSNTAANAINNRTLQHWMNGKLRKDITFKEMEDVIQRHALTEEKGLHRSDLILKGFITAYIAFLPLERAHVKQCIKAGLLAKKYYTHAVQIPDIKVQQIADELSCIRFDWMQKGPS